MDLRGTSLIYDALISVILLLSLLSPVVIAGEMAVGTGGNSPVPPGLLWVDTNHEEASVNRKQVAITADGEYVLSGWWINNERVQLYRGGDTQQVEWRADIAGTEWFLPLESDHSGHSMVCATRGDSGELQSRLILWDTSSPEPVYSKQSPPGHLWVDTATCDDGRFFFGLAQGPSPDYVGRAICFQRQTGLVLWSYQLEGQAIGMDCSADGTRLAVSCRSDTTVLDTSSGQLLDLVIHPGGSQTLPSLSGDGALLAVGTSEGQLMLSSWNGSAYLQRWQYLFPVLDDEPFVSAVDISDDGSTVAAGTLDFPDAVDFGGSILLFDSASPLPLFSDTGFGDQINEVELTADGSRVAVVSHGRLGGGDEALMSVYDRDSGRTVFSVSDTVVPGIGSAFSVAMSVDGIYAAFGGKACHAREEGAGGYVAMVRLATSFLSILDAHGGETDEFLVGQDLDLLLEACDANTDAGSRQTVVVRVINALADDEELVPLQETAEDSGLFSGTVPTLFSPFTLPVAGDGSLECGSGDLVRAIYIDENDPADQARAEATSRWRTHVVAAPGPGRNNPGAGRIFDPFGQADLGAEILPYGTAGYGLNVAMGDIDGRGVDEIVTGPGPGPLYGPLVKAFNAEGDPISTVSFMAYGTWRYGVNVACGDVDGDGVDEIITGPGPGAMFGPHVRGWDADGSAVTPVPGLSFFAYGTRRHGVNVACGDVDGDGIDEILTGAGPGTVFGPHVRGWNHDGGVVTPIPGISFLAYGTNRYGVNVACGDLDGDRRAEIITAPGPGPMLSSHIRAWKFDCSGVSPVPGVSFMAYGSAHRYGASVTAGDIDLDDMDEIITVPGADPDALVRVRGFKKTSSGTMELEYAEFLAFEETVTHGGNVAAGSLR